MLRKLMGTLWRNTPWWVRRGGVWLTQPRFTVTAGAVVRDERGRVLLLSHTFRQGSGWGIPGGFIARGEQPAEAIRREVREETGLELLEPRLAFVRTLSHVQQVEVIFAGRLPARALEEQVESLEVRRAEWFEPDRLPPELGPDQRRLIGRVLDADASPPDR